MSSQYSSTIPIEFVVGGNQVIEGELRHVLSPRTIDKILKILPINSRIHLWKKELYFEIGIRMGSEKALDLCEAGDIAYWPQGDAVCIFFEKMTPHGKVNPLGKVPQIDFEDVFSSLRSGMPIRLRLKST